MFAKEKLFDDVARLAGSGVGIFSGIQKQIREEIRSHLYEMADQMDLVPREDYERLETMVQDLRTRIETLEKQTKK